MAEFGETLRAVATMFRHLVGKYVARKYPSRPERDTETEVEREFEAIGRKIAQRFTRGNVNIQQGAFLTKKDLADRTALRRAKRA